MKLVNSDEVLAMFCGDCCYRGEPLDSPLCSNCSIRNRIDKVSEQHQQHNNHYKSG